MGSCNTEKVNDFPQGNTAVKELTVKPRSPGSQPTLYPEKNVLSASFSIFWKYWLRFIVKAELNFISVHVHKYVYACTYNVY